MTDQLRAAVKALPQDINVKPSSTVVTALAIIGAGEVAATAVRLTNKFVQNRKAKKAAKVVETDSPQQ